MKGDEDSPKAIRIEELQKLKEELEIANEAKDYELKKPRKEKEEEVSKKDADRDEKSRRNEELRKANEEMEMKNKAKDEEIEKLRKEKNEKMQKLRKEKS
ncbi:hypothetical protein LINPERHAP1_LOCUS31172 [Linum perenne]